MPTMRCYCITHHGQPLALQQRDVPEPQGSEVLVRVTAAGLCHSDLHLWEGHYDLGGGKKLSLADRGIKLPLTPSHEICGEVAGAGPDAAAELAALQGQAVVVHPWIGCGQCPACQRGEENLCMQHQFMGVARPGGFAEYVLVPHPRYLVPLGDMDVAEAAPLACAGVTTFSALNKFDQRLKTEPLVIIGAGGLGLMALALNKAQGGQGAVVVDIDPVKREAALAAGALAAIDPQAADAVAQLTKATGGGARAVLDLVGATPTVSLAVAASARGGHIVVCGLMGGDITLSLPVIPMRPLTLQGSYVGTLPELRLLVDLVRRTGIKTVPVSRRPLAEANDAMQQLMAGRVVGRTVLIP